MEKAGGWITCLSNDFGEECVYLNTFENGAQADKEISAWLMHYNQTRPHSTFKGQTPDEVYNKEYCCVIQR